MDENAGVNAVLDASRQTKQQPMASKAPIQQASSELSSSGEQSATAVAVPTQPFKIVEVDIIEQVTGEILRSNVEMKFWDKDFTNDVTISQMAAKALEQSELKAEHYTWREVKQCKTVANESIEFVEVYFDDPIEHGAFYKVEVVRKQKKIVNAAIDVLGQQQMVDQSTTNSKGTIQQPFGKGNNNITIKQEFPESCGSVGPVRWSPVKQENSDEEYSEFSQLALQQPSTSTSKKTAPPPAKATRKSKRVPKPKKQEVEAVRQQKRKRQSSPTDPATDGVQQQPSSSKRVVKQKKQ